MEWKKLKNYETCYEISEFGDIRSITRVTFTNNRFGKMERIVKERILKSHKASNNYLMIELNNNKKVKKILIHRLVYLTFIGDLITGMIIHHKDGNKSNNHYSNLEQIDFLQHNNIHSHQAWNKGIKNPKSMVLNAVVARKKNYLLRCEKTFYFKEQGVKNKDIALLLGISERQVSSRIKNYRSLIINEKY